MAPSSAEMMNAVRHPLRRRIIRAFLSAEVQRPTASELAEVIDQRVGQVAYHLKTLAMCEILRSTRGGDGHEPENPHYGWALGIHSDWLRAMLDVVESDVYS